MNTRQLILIRQFFVDARITPAAETPFLRIRRTLHLDLCVELALNVVVRDFGTPGEQDQQGGRRDLSRDKLWELAAVVVVGKSGKTIPERSALKTLHEVRNLAQHRGSVPSGDDLRAAVEPVRALLEFCCRELYGLDFERLRDWDALECDTLRTWLDDCFEAAEKGSSVLAIGGCQLLFRRVVDCIQRGSVGADASRSLPIGMHTEWEGLVGPLTDLVKRLQAALIAVQAQMVALSVGLPAADHFRFEKACGWVVVHEFTGGSYTLEVVHQDWPTEPEEARRNAAFMVDYVGRACVLLESAYPGAFADLELPSRLRDSRLWSAAPSA